VGSLGDRLEDIHLENQPSDKEEGGRSCLEARRTDYGEYCKKSNGVREWRVLLGCFTWCFFVSASAISFCFCTICKYVYRAYCYLGHQSIQLQMSIRKDPRTACRRSPRLVERISSHVCQNTFGVTNYIYDVELVLVSAVLDLLRRRGLCLQHYMYAVCMDE